MVLTIISHGVKYEFKFEKGVFFMTRVQKIILFVVVFGPICLMASTDTKFGADVLNQQTDAIKNFLFGAPMRIAGVFGGAYGFLMSIASSSFRPLLIFGGIGLAANFVPIFVEKVFVSGMLLP